jgi:hypothetical protein
MIEVGISGTCVPPSPKALDLVARGGPAEQRGTDRFQIPASIRSSLTILPHLPQWMDVRFQRLDWDASTEDQNAAFVVRKNAFCKPDAKLNVSRIGIRSAIIEP